jgi:hypothetical protein
MIMLIPLSWLGIMPLTNFSGGRDAALRRPRPDGANVVKAPFFRRLTLRSAPGTAQRAIPTLIVCERHNPIMALPIGWHFRCRPSGVTNSNAPLYLSPE